MFERLACRPGQIRKIRYQRNRFVFLRLFSFEFDRSPLYRSYFLNAFSLPLENFKAICSESALLSNFGSIWKQYQALSFGPRQSKSSSPRKPNRCAQVPLDLFYLISRSFMRCFSAEIESFKLQLNRIFYEQLVN